MKHSDYVQTTRVTPARLSVQTVAVCPRGGAVITMMTVKMAPMRKDVVYIQLPSIKSFIKDFFKVEAELKPNF